MREEGGREGGVAGGGREGGVAGEGEGEVYLPESY